MTKSIKQKYEESDNFMEFFCHIVYRNVGVRVLKNKKFNNFFYTNFYNKKYEKILREANLRIIPKEYLSTVLLVMMFSFFVFSLVVPFVLVFVSLKFAVNFFYFSFIFLVFEGISFYNYPISIANQRRAEIDAGVVHVIPYLKILSKELNLQNILKVIPDFIVYKEIKVEFDKIKYYYEFLGYDIYNSVRQAMDTCPSFKLSELLNDLVSISNSGGSLYKYMDEKVRNLDEDILGQEKRTVDSLLIYSQIYVILLLIAPLFFAIMTSILDLVQLEAVSSATASSAKMNILMLIVGLPFAFVFIMFLVYFSKPLYKRIVTIKKKNGEMLK